ncbi:hypothetical protein STEG23_029627 [Scotinomys teguina]
MEETDNGGKPGGRLGEEQNYKELNVMLQSSPAVMEPLGETSNVNVWGKVVFDDCGNVNRKSVFNLALITLEEELGSGDRGRRIASDGSQTWLYSESKSSMGYSVASLSQNTKNEKKQCNTTENDCEKKQCNNRKQMAVKRNNVTTETKVAVKRNNVTQQKPLTVKRNNVTTETADCEKIQHKMMIVKRNIETQKKNNDYYTDILPLLPSAIIYITYQSQVSELLSCTQKNWGHTEI